MASTTSCEVGPAGLSMRIAPSNGSNGGMASARRVEGLFYRGDDTALGGQRSAADARAGGGVVAAAAKPGGDLVDIDPLAFGPEADPGEFRFQFLEHTGDDDGFDGADMIDEPLGVGGIRAGAGEGGLPEPEPGDLVVVSEVEMVVDMFEQPDAGQGVGLVDLVADGGWRAGCWDIGTNPYRSRWR